MLNPKQLRLLVELSERGTISAVAAALHFTPSTVSHGLAMLEHEVGVALLERSARRVRLTRAGEVLVREGQVALQRLAGAEADARAEGGIHPGRITIGTIPSAGATIGVRALRLLRARHPTTEVRLLHAEPDASLPELAAGALDTAIVYLHPQLPSSIPDGLRSTNLLDDPIRVALPPDHPAAARTSVPFESLRDEGFIGGARFIQAMCRAYGGFEPQIVCRSADVAFSCSLVNAGAGVSIMPQLLADTAPEDVVLRELVPAPAPRALIAVYRSSAEELPGVRAAVSALHDAAGKG